MVGKDLIMATLLGSGGGSSGSGGGGSAGVSPKEVNFYDYDGTCVHAYTVAEAQALSELPAGPEHPGLVFQGWNWSLEGAKGLTRAMNIGAMYTTDDGTTRLHITLPEGRTSPMLGVGVNGTVTVDWGDGTEPDVLTGTNTSTTVWTPNHAYAKPGDYIIRLTVDGEMAFTGSATEHQYACILRCVDTTDKRNAAYQNALRSVEIGDGMTKINGHAFRNCGHLHSVIIPATIKEIGLRAFSDVFGIEFIVFPDSATKVWYESIYGCKGLKSVSIPENATYIGPSAFCYCDKLYDIYMPDGVTGIGGSAFMSCKNLTKIGLPGTLEYGLGSEFNGCRSLASVTIPGGLKKIASQMFCDCFGVGFYDFTAYVVVPTLEKTSAFNGIPADCEIRVPAALYEEWIAATNWATFASQIKAY